MNLDKLTTVKNTMSLTKTLKEKDLIVLMDISGSMDSVEETRTGGFLCFGGEVVREKRIEAAKTLLKAHFDILKTYGGGKALKVVLFNHRSQLFLVENQADLDALLDKTQAGGSTDTANALDRAFQNVSNEAVVIVYTDGYPDNDRAVANVLASKAKHVDDTKFGVLFAQIGNDSAATRLLSWLDDSLTQYTDGKDIVGSMTFDKLKEATIEELVQEALLG
jgi:uncharacterized protein with von Willebrand factor type A (vWA) domain